MDLLPKTRDEFAKTDYWDAFFKKRGNQAFEWYGEYLELCDQIHKYIKAQDCILVVGCGNSRLSLEMFDFGFQNITNIDISAVAIRKMQEQRKQRLGMRFIEMDATAMSFENASFSVVLDKGTLDAIFVDDTPATIDQVRRYFAEITRVMKPLGRYVCVSLLQEHILKFLLEELPHLNFMVRVVQCVDADRANQLRKENPDACTYPIFMVIATKLFTLPQPIYECCINNGSIDRCSPEDVKRAVVSLQRVSLVCSSLSRTQSSGYREVSLDLHHAQSDKHRFTLHVVDHPIDGAAGHYAAFIVPLGREVEWLFSTPEGRRHLQLTSKYRRLAVVTCVRDQEYKSLEDVKEEVAASVANLAPVGHRGELIPFLSVGSDLGSRETLVSGHSQLSGEFRIEDVTHDDGTIYRRLIFMNQQNVIQSEALVKTIKLKGKKERKRIDVTYLACQHHAYMSVGVQLALDSSGKEMQNVLVVGLGGGGLCTFLRATFERARITAVEIDPIMLEIAEQFFEMKQEKRLTVVIDDGVAFLHRCREEDIKFDVIILDVDNKEHGLGISCPPMAFLDRGLLATVKELVAPLGIFMLNLVCRSEPLSEGVYADLGAIFESVCRYKMKDEVNELLYCSDNPRYRDDAVWRQMLGDAARNLKRTAKEGEYSDEKDTLDVTRFLQELKF